MDQYPVRPIDCLFGIFDQRRLVYPDESLRHADTILSNDLDVPFIEFALA